MLLYVDATYLSPYAMSAFVALTEKGQVFETKTIDLMEKQNKEPAYIGLSLTGRVPTLVEDEFTLSESSAIAEYLDQTRLGVALFPSDAKQRARARQVQAWLRSDLVPLRQERPTKVIFHGSKLAPLSVSAQSAATVLFSFAEAILARGSETLFEEWSIADLDLAIMLNRLIAHGDAVPTRLVDYTLVQWARPAVKAWAGLDRPAL